MTARSRRTRAREHVIAALVGVALFGLFVGAWKAYVVWFDVSKFVLPPPESVARATVDLLSEHRTWHHVWVTFQEIAVGFLAATVFGVLVGVAIGEVRLLDRALTPYLVALQVLPKVAIVPLLLLWFGFGPSAKEIVAATFAFFPITAGTRAGVRAVDPGHRDLVTVLRARPWQRLVNVEMPSALPAILTGMEIGIVLATIGAVVAEYIAGSEGLGWLAVTSLNQLQVDRLFGVIVILSLLGCLLYAVVAGARRLLVPWHHSTRFASGVTP